MNGRTHRNPIAITCIRMMIKHSTRRPKPVPRQLILINYYSCPYLALVKILSKISGPGSLSGSALKSNQLLLVTHPTPLKHFLLTYKSAKAKI